MPDANKVLLKELERIKVMVMTTRLPDEGRKRVFCFVCDLIKDDITKDQKDKERKITLVK